MAAAEAAPPLAPNVGRYSRQKAHMTTTAIYIPKDAHAVLRLAAVRRANAGSGRPSVSDVITDLIERHRAVRPLDDADRRLMEAMRENLAR